MTDLSFFPAPAPLTVGEIAELTGARLLAGDASRQVSGVATLAAAGPGDIAFIDNPQYLADLERTAAAACFCGPRFSGKVPAGVAALEVREPNRAVALVSAKLFPAALKPTPLAGGEGISDRAIIHPTARVEAGATIEATAVIGAQVEIGAGALIGPGAVIGARVRIGRDSVVGAGVTLVHSLIGNRVIIHAGCRIGQDGFGFVPGPRGHLKVPQLARVLIQDDVEIGANTTIDRGSIRDTVIGEGSKIDNQVQIAHNVVMGRLCLIAAKTGISGSVTIGDFVAMGGGVGIAPHVTIGAGASIAAASGVMRDIPPGTKWGGYPAVPAREWMRGVALLRQFLAREGGRGRGADAANEGGAAET